MEVTASPRPLVRFERADLRLIGLALALLAASLWVAGHYFHRAFPESSIDFRVSSAGSQPIAEAFLAARGLNPAGDMHATEFAYDDEAKTFLERELGLERTEALLRTRIRLWRWEHRWFRPLTKEEFDIAVSTSGDVVGFNHPIADEAPGANLTEDQARAIAVDFIGSVMHLDIGKLQPVGADREQRAHRTDYTYAWKDIEPLVPNATGDMAEAEYRHVIRVQGDQVGQYREYLRVPDQWTRDYARLRSRNETAGEIDTGLMLLVLVAMLIVLSMRVRSSDVRWRAALWIGGAGAALSLLSTLNGFSQALYNYDTTQSYAGFVSGELLSAVLSALGVGVFFLALTATAESLYRERFPRKVALENWMTLRGIRSRRFFNSVLIGLALAAFFFAYQAVFYLIANHFGAWAPADVPYDDLLNTRFPWAFVLFSGFFPAISEEFGFRMLAIPLFEKWFRFTWIAVIAASFLWGFGHATYPNEPFWIRGVEVGLGGILLSWVMIRFGILATVVWHYTVDAFYTAMLLLRAHDAYLRFSGGFTAFLAVAPLLFALLAYWRRGGFEPDDDLTNASVSQAQGHAVAAEAAAVEPEAATEAEAIPEPQYEPVSGPDWTLGIIIAGALLAAFAVPLLAWATAMPWRTPPPQAIAQARAFLTSQGFDVSAYRVGITAATPDSLGGGLGDQNTVAAADIFHANGRRALIEAFSGTSLERGGYYRVRFYRALQEEEFTVAVPADGNPVLGFAHTLPDAAPGASPSSDNAEIIARDYLASQGLDVSTMALRTATQERRPARTDSDLVWENTATSPLPGEVALRIEVELAGGHVSVMHAWYHVPEARVRDFERGTFATTALAGLRYLMFAGLAGLLLWHILAFLRSRQPWVPVVRVAIAAAVISLLVSLNSLPATAASSYSTSSPWSAWMVEVIVGLAVAALGGFVGTLVLLPPLAISFPRAWTLLTEPRSRDAWEHAWAWDALWTGLMAVGWMLGWGRVQSVVAAHWHHAAEAPMFSPVDGLGDFWPGGSGLFSAPLHALWIAAILGLVLPVLFRGWSLGGARRWTALGGWLLLWIGATAGTPVHTASEFLFAAALAAISIGLLCGFAAMFLGDNPLSYVSAVLVPLLAIGAADWFGLGYRAARFTGALYVIAALAWILWLAWHARHARNVRRLALIEG